jgi:hypothetical protein
VTAFAPAYRMRIYASDDTTILQTAGGTKALFATRAGVTDANGTYLDWLEQPNGKRGVLDVLLKRTDTGEITVKVMDPRLTVGGSNAARGFVQFLGDAGGQEQLKGLKTVIEESRDGGATWLLGGLPWFTGRIQQVSNTEPVYFELVLWDTSAELSTIDVFTGDPHSSITYVAREQLLPFGLTQAYGPFPAARSVEHADGFLAIAGDLSTWSSTLTLTGLSQRDLGNVLTDRLAALLEGPPVLGATWAWAAGAKVGQSKLWARVKHLSGAHSGSTYRYPINGFYLTNTSPDTHQHLTAVILCATGGTGPLPANGVSCAIALYSAAQATATTPLYVGDVDPLQFWEDLLLGKFGRLDSGGAVLRTVPYDSAAFTALKTKFGTVRFILADVANLHDWIETNLLQPLGLGYMIDPAGQVVPLDLRLPAALGGLPALTDADLGPVAPQWTTTRDTAYAWFSCTHWLEQQVTSNDMQRDPATFPEMPPGGIRASELEYALASIGPRILNLQTQTFTGEGLRAGPGEILNGRDRAAMIELQIAGTLNDLATRFANGAYIATAEVRLTAADALVVGSWVLVTFSLLPDPATKTRGGQRLMQVVEKSPGALHTTLQLLDAGVATTASVPSLGALAQQTDNTRHGIAIPVTLNAASDPVQIQGALTATSVGSAPADGEPLWHLLGKVTTAGTFTAFGLPAGMRLWVRARSEPSQGFQFPSAWATPATDHCDTAAITAPSSLASAVTGTRVLCTWAVGDATLPVRFYLCTPTGTPLPVLDLPPGSTRYPLEGLAASTGYTFGVAHPDPQGGTSAVATANFTTSTSTRTAPGPGGLAVLVGITV